MRNRLASQTRSTVVQQQTDGGTLNSRITDEPDLYQREIYAALNLNAVLLPPHVTTI